MKKLLIFDLDGTLAESKCALTNEMSHTLTRALDKFSIAVISGGAYPQFEKQFLSNLHCPFEFLDKLYLFPTCATSFHRYGGVITGWERVYSEELSASQRIKIIESFRDMFDVISFQPSYNHGEVIEDRLTQITFSALGQQAPVELKKQWDSNHTKRLAMIEVLGKMIPEFEIRTGGSTSIDVTRKGIDKAYGIDKIQELLGFQKQEMIFMGDALFEGGNDAPVKRTGIDCVQVSGPSETMEIVEKLINS